ncbi:MAG: molybdopterin molybdotransferase MoeA [Planctomycetales bacterium]
MMDSNASSSPRDARMRGFASRSAVSEAIAWLDDRVGPLPMERAPLADSAGRALAEDVVSPCDVPAFVRGMMDGFALRAADTQGAAAYNPLTFQVIGEALPGAPFDGTVESGQAVRIMTGAPAPQGADAVLPVEFVEINGDRIQALADVSAGKHIGRVGEDIAQGSKVLSAGRKLRPQDLGVLSSIGVSQVPVTRRPRVRIVITGNELLPPGSPPEANRICDANSPMLRALVARDGGIALHAGITPDSPEAILESIRDPEADVVLVFGGSSVGQEDYAPSLVAQHGELAIHGIAMRPSRPAGMGNVEARLVFLLPGNPVSCLCAYDFFAGRAIRGLAGLPTDWPYPRRTVKLKRKISSQVGRLDYARVALVDDLVEPLAVGGASMLSSTTRADGFVIIPSDSEGFPPDAEVEVFLYDPP